MKKILFALALILIFSLSCSLSGTSSQTGEDSAEDTPIESQHLCGDGVCDGPENAQACPEDCTENNDQNLNATQGAGIQSAMHLVNAEVDCLITGHCGPKAFQVLETANIKVYLCDAKTIADAYALFKEGKLEIADGANAESHWV